MKLKEYIAHLQNYAKKNPEMLGKDVITSIDDEGNGYNAILFAPTKGYINEDLDFIDVDSADEEEKTGQLATCVN